MPKDVHLKPVSNPPIVTKRTCITLSDGARVSVRRWGQERDQRVVISHGNGLAVNGLWEFGRELMDEFEVIAFDLRNHGESLPAAQADMPWHRYIADIPEIFDAISDAFGSKKTHGAFHSMSSVCVLVAQLDNPRPWSTLTLFEPPLAPSIAPDILHRFEAMQKTLGERTLRRRRYFDSPQELARSFERAEPFSGIDSGVIQQLASALLRKIDNGWELSCAPEFETANFVTVPSLSTRWSELSKIDVPVQLVLGDPSVHDMPILVEMGQLMAGTFGFHATECAGENHFMQMRQPTLCAQKVADFIKRHGKASMMADAAKTRGIDNDASRGAYP